MVQNYLYLGIIFNASGNFTQAVSNLRDKAIKAYFNLVKKTYSCTVNLSLKLFEFLVKPIMNYGCEIWMPYYWKDLNDTNMYNICDKVLTEKLHVKFLKSVLGVHRHASNAAVRGEVGSFPVLISQSKQSIKYLVRLSKMSFDSLAHKSYLECKQMVYNNKPCWLTGIKELFRQNGKQNAWHNIYNGTGNVSCYSLLADIQCSLETNYAQQWFRVISNIHGVTGVDRGNKLRTYCLFKKKFCMENYLLCTSSKAQRAEFAKLRISSHKLMIESGRCNKPNIIPADKRYCIYTAKMAA
jgi:hypothetical protein